MGKIEELFGEFVKQADILITGDKEGLMMVKAMYYTAIAHFLMAESGFIMAERSGKKMIQHLSMLEEIKEYMTSINDELQAKKAKEAQEPQEPHEKH